MSQHYSDPRRESGEHALPDLEVFYFDEQRDTHDAPYNGSGWYWWPCFPGCLPDGDPVGPFATEAEALADAREGMESE